MGRVQMTSTSSSGCKVDKKIWRISEEKIAPNEEK